MKRSARFFAVFLLVSSVVAATAAGAWAAPVSAAQYLQDHPNLATYLHNNPQVASEVEGGAHQTASQLVNRLVQVVGGFGTAYEAQHKYLTRYLANNSTVARRIADQQRKSNSGNGQSGNGQSGNGQSGNGQSGNGQSGNNNFVDVPSWAQQAVKAMADRAIIKGEGNHRFGSNQVLNRAQFATLLVREFDLLSTGGSVNSSYVDVPSTAWYYKYVEAAAPDMDYWEAGDQKYFRPMAPALREDCAVAMVEAAGLAGQAQSVNASAVLAKFTDAAKISPGLVNLVAVAVQTGLIAGSQNKTSGEWYLNPQASLTRAQGAVLLYRALDYTKLAP